MKLEIRNGHVIDPRNHVDRPGTLYIAAGRVLTLDHAPADWHANRVLDASGLVVCPGLVDVGVRLREPGTAVRATIETEMGAAVAGGVTSLACLPDTDPTLDEPGLVEMLKFRALALNLAHVFPLGALTVGLKGEALTEMSALHDAGCVAFTQAEHPIANHQVLFRAMQYAATLGYPVWLRPQDAWIGRHGVAHEGEIATRLGLTGIPALAETMAVRMLLALAREAGCVLHLCRLSCAESVQMVRAAKAEGASVSCDVAAHHLHLTEMDIAYFDAQCNVRPPLRTQADQAGLLAGVADGTIDCITSDHTPLDDDAKEMPFGEAEPGMSGVELLLSLTLKWAHEHKIPLATALARITATPARLLNVPIGHLAPGAAADLCIFDPRAYRVISRASMVSAGKNSAFLGYELPGLVRYTLVGGRIVYESTAPQ